MKDLEKATNFLNDRLHKFLGLSQSIYMDKVLMRFSLEESKQRFFFYVTWHKTLKRNITSDTRREGKII